MSSFSMAFFIALAISFLAICLWKILNWVWLKPKKLEKLLRQQGFSGNSYKLFHGDNKELSRMTIEAMSRPISLSDDIAQRVRPFDYHIIAKYGKNSFSWKGPTPRVNITDPTLIKEILFKHETFQKPQRNPLGELFVNGMAMYEGDQWFKVRKIANPAFHMEKLKDISHEIYTSCNDMIEKWKLLFSKDKESCELDMWPEMQALTADVISRTAFGSNFEEGRQIFELIRKQAQLLNQVVQYVYIPGWRFLPTAMNKELQHNYNQMQELIKGIISKREEALRVGKARNDDLLSLLIESNYKTIKEKEIGMSIQEVIEECKLFYIAGQDTTSVLLLWTMVLLSTHPNWQERAREEVIQVFGKRKPTFDDLHQLKIVTQILNEVLRLYPPAAVLIRSNKKETKIGDIFLPPGTTISMPIILLHRDPTYWGDDALEFKPDRFAQGISKASKNNDKVVAFFPFSWGPRICIGQNFALMEAKLALAMILQNFSFQLSPSYIHAPAERFLLYPQHGAHLILNKIII